MSPIRPIEPKAIIETTAAYYRIPVDDLKYNKEPRNVEARLVAMVLCREITGLSWAVLGRAFDVHHTSVMHARNKSWPKHKNSLVEKRLESIREAVLQEAEAEDSRWASV